MEKDKAKQTAMKALRAVGIGLGCAAAACALVFTLWAAEAAGIPM